MQIRLTEYRVPSLGGEGELTETELIVNLSHDERRLLEGLAVARGVDLPTWIRLRLGL